MHIFLIGMKHTGKTSIGRELAGRRALPFHDLDERVMDLYAEQHGRRLMVRDIYRTVGAALFQELERTALERLLDCENSAAPTAGVLALGGGTGENEPVMRIVKARGLVICLEASEGTLFERIRKGGLPPFLCPHDPAGSFARLYEQRTRLYRSLADLTIDVEGRTVRDAVDSIEIYLDGRSSF